MILRVLATLAAIAVPLLLTFAVAQPLLELPWLGPALAFALALPVVLAAKQARTQALVGAGLAAMAAAASPELPEQLEITGDPEALAVHDLREGPLPAGATGYVAVRGFLRGDWQVDEYRVAAGERPDQNEQAAAVLVPLLGSREEVIAVEADAPPRVIVARVTPAQLASRSLVTLRGRVGPVAPEIVESLFAIGVDAQGKPTLVAALPEAVLLDTLDLPTRGQALTRLGLAIGAALLAWVLLLLALPRREKARL